jgi:hypothetical protein
MSMGHWWRTRRKRRRFRVENLKAAGSEPVDATMWLPHAAQAKSLGTGRGIEEIARGPGWRVRILPKLSVTDGANAVRTRQ